MTDIVKRLRLWQHGKYKIHPPHMDKAIFYEGDCGEAADLIEKLWAERDALLEFIKTMIDHIEQYEPDGKRIGATIRTMRDRALAQPPAEQEGPTDDAIDAAKEKP